MAKTGIVKRSFPYAEDGVNVRTLKEGEVLSFPDRIFDGLASKKDAHGEAQDPYIVESDEKPQNSVAQTRERDGATDDMDRRLSAASDQELKDIIARSGRAYSGNLVHAVMVSMARTQLQREAGGHAPVRGVDPNSGVTEQPLARPGEAPANATVAAVKHAPENRAKSGAPETARTNQFGEPQYDAMKPEDLERLAEERGVSLKAGATKPDIIKALKRADAEKK
jgi:hypothetical protein